MNNILDIKSPSELQADSRKCDYGLQNHGLTNLNKVYWNLPTEAFYEEAIFRNEARITLNGALIVNTGKHTARAANDKFIVREPSTEEHIWWGQYNRPYSAKSSMICLTASRVSFKGGTCSSRIAMLVQIRTTASLSGLSPSSPGPTAWPRLAVTDTEQIPRIMDRLFRRKLAVTDMKIKSPSLETVFLKLTGPSLRD